MRFIYSLEAKSQLWNIKDYGERVWGREQSKKYIHELTSTIKLITTQPTMGKIYVHEQSGTELRYFPCKSHQIFYVIDNDVIVIMALLGMRQLPVKFFERNF